MKKLLFVFILFGNLFLFSQNKKTTQIVEEGKLLYRLEKGSWFGTDDMLVRFKNKKDSIGGYLSYETEDNKINTIFFSRYDTHKILVRYQFDSLPKPTPIAIDTNNQKATEKEINLITIRQDARNRAFKNLDKFFVFYKKTSLNFIPVIKDGKRQVFILTGPQVGDVVIIGNDYLLKYTKKNIFKNKEKLHNSMLQFATKSNDKDKPTVSTIHSHVLTDYITSTDICTLLLYKDYLDWKQHIVISKKEVSIFNLEDEVLVVMKTKAWEKISKHQKQNKK